MKKIVTISFIIIFSLGFSQEKYEVGNLLFDKMEYKEAAKIFESQFENGDKSMVVLEKIGDAYYFSTEMNLANKWYGKLISTYGKAVSPKYFYRYAQSYIGIGKVNQGKKWMMKFSKKDYKANLDSVGVVQEYSEYSLKNISINTMYSEFGPTYYNDKLIFSSAKDSNYFKASSNVKQLPFLNFYIGNLGPDKTDVISSKEFSTKINSKLNEATLCFSKDLKKVYYTGNSITGNKNSNVDKKLKIYSATAKQNNNGEIEWKSIKELPFNNDNYSVGHPAISPDGKKIYFVSDMPGTIGGADIFVVDILPNDNYSKPKNLGPTINTFGKEMFPFVTENKLYFSSNSHNGLGGLDVFESEYLNSTFNSPKNLGEPLNSSFDDFSFIIKEDLSTGFVCSNRTSGKGDDDIYFFERTKAGICKQFISGYISNNITGERITNAKISLFSKKGDKLKEVVSDANGNYKFQQEFVCNNNYLLKVERIGYKNGEKLFSINKSLSEIIVPIGLDRIHELIVEENGLLKIKIGAIYFDLNKWDIRQDAALEFDKIVSLMNEYPKMIIDIESHTDSRGQDKLNLILSRKRAKAAKDYIIFKGIDASRIRNAEGFGETQLMNKCQNGKRCSESMHQLNRRSEFIILKI
ncbi:WD40-like Beta Propeller Repeat [Lutibacter oricola]|uniref:WD40-like Beta Propeller Repeat n=1 Tax=Lutibacter oricola TaxID=762486 RepID=A0A1H3GLV3_9FLAO|nr:OmpA family protein [Lutibacter oricola]SDY04303.1 WD40-like Beta Propeller Repeat [Lutibacter oricola]